MSQASDNSPSASVSLPQSVPTPAPTRLAYAFAKERGILVLNADVRPIVIGARGNPDPWALIEARRAVGGPIVVDEMPADAFERRLSEIYSVEGIPTEELDFDGEEADLESLADGLPICLLYTSDAADE